MFADCFDLLFESLLNLRQFASVNPINIHNIWQQAFYYNYYFFCEYECAFVFILLMVLLSLGENANKCRN